MRQGTVAVRRAGSRERLEPATAAGELRGLVARQPLFGGGGDGTDVRREGVRDRRRRVDAVGTERRGLDPPPHEQRDEREHAGRCRAKGAHRERALQPSSFRSRSEVAAHD